MTVSLCCSRPTHRSAAAAPQGRSTAVIGVLLAVVLGTAALPARAAITCTVTATGVAFGSYDVFSTTPLDGTGHLQIVCNGNPSFTASLSPGGGSYSPRVMRSSNGRTLNYNLYTDATRTTVWGNGVGGTATVSGISAKPVIDATIYGRIPARQNAWVESYSDTVTLTVTY